MKKFLISVLDWANIKYDKAAIEAADNIDVSEENMAKIEASLAEAKGFKEMHEKAAADLLAANENLTKATTDLKAAQDTLEAVTGERDTATASLEEANATIAELREAAGEDPTGAGKKKGDEKKEHSYVNPEATHNKFIQEQLAKAGMTTED